MAKFKTVVEAVLRNSIGGELARIVMEPKDEFYVIPPATMYLLIFCVGDTITIESRETEVE